MATTTCYAETMTESRLLTVPEVAARLRVTAETVRRWLRGKRIQGISFGSDRAGWRIPETEVERIEREGMTSVPTV